MRANHMSASQVIKTLLTLHLHTSLIYILLFELFFCVSIAGFYLIWLSMHRVLTGMKEMILEHF